MSEASSLSVRLQQALRDQGRFLIFGLKAEDYRRLDWTHLAVGGFFTWLVGIARNWDYPDAVLPARLGLYSVAYIFVLALVLWVFSLPLQQFKTSYLKVLAAVSMTAPYGLIYGIPVEMMVDTRTAITINGWFLVFVALIRVVAFLHFLQHGVVGKIGGAFAVIAIPISLLGLVLHQTGRVGQIINTMGGMRNVVVTDPQAGANTILFTGMIFTTCLAPLSLIIYLFAWVQHNDRMKGEAKDDSESSSTR